MYTPVAEIPGIVSSIKSKYDEHTTKSYAWRIEQLKALREMLIKENDRMFAAMEADLKQTIFLKLIETKSCLADVDGAISDLREWMKPVPKTNNVIGSMPGSAYMIPV